LSFRTGSILLLKYEKCGVSTDNNFKAAVDGKITSVSYMFPRPGETEPVAKVSYVTGVGDQGCGVGYYK
jgi:hypothetical protein